MTSPDARWARHRVDRLSWPRRAAATMVVLVNASTLEGGPVDRLFDDLAGLLFPERFAGLRGQR